MHAARSIFGSLAAATLLSATVAGGAHGALIAFDDFESYAPGSALNGGAGGSGWTSNWTADANHVTVQPFTLTNSFGDPVGGTQAVRINGAAGDVVSMMARNFTSTTADNVYMAMLVRIESLESDDFINMQLTNGASGNVADSLGVGFRNAPGNPLFARAGTSGAPGVTNDVHGVADMDYLLVARLTKAGNGEYETTALFINPTSSAEPALANVTATSTQPNITALSRFNVRDFNPEVDDVKWIDQIRIATTFAEAVSGLTTAQPTVVLDARADAHVQSGASANTNFGNAAVLDIKNEVNNAGGFHRKTYISFDVSSINLDAVGTASLSLMIAPSAGVDPAPPETWVFNLYGLNESFVPSGAELDENWDETAITWNNAPANNTANGSGVDLADVFGGDPLASFTILGAGVPGTIINLNDPALLAFLQDDADGLVTFILARATQEFGGNTVVHRFHSGESTAGLGPQLSLTFVAVPEPATATLALLAVGVLARRRRMAA